MTHPKFVLRLVAGLLILFGAVSCSSDDPAAPIPVADVDAYLANLPSWDSFSPPMPDADDAVGAPVDSTEVVDGTTYECVTTHYSLTQTPEKLVTLNPDVEVLWVGSLLQGSGYVGGLGSLAELPIRQRGPLTLAIDLLTGENTRTVADPDLASVGSAIGDLIQTASDAGHRAGSRIAYNEVSYHSLAEASLKLGFSAAYSGVTASAELAASVSAEKTSIMVTFTQQMFTVSQVLPQTPGEMFSSAFTEDLLQEQVSRGRLGPNNLPVYVSSIVYGRMLVFTMTAAATAAEIRAAVGVAAGDIGGELSSEQRLLLETSEIGLVALGGDAASAEAAIRAGDFSAYFAEESALTTARPISYTVRNLADNSVAAVSETTEYDVTNCAAEVTGAVYSIQIIDTTYLERRLCGVIPICQILFRAKFFVEDDLQTTLALDAQTQDFMCVDDSHAFPGAATVTGLRLHYDGRDQIRIFGDIWTDYPNHFVWGPGIVLTGDIAPGIRGSSVWNPAGCHRFGIRYRVTKTGVLTD